MRSIRFVLLMACLSIALLLFGCDQPEYLNPYGDGVDPDTVTTNTFRTRESTTATSSLSQTTQPTELIIPEGYHLCPECNGVRVVCEYCDGTGERKIEAYDAEADVYGYYLDGCTMCSTEDPGFVYCENCQNLLIVPD